MNVREILLETATLLEDEPQRYNIVRPVVPRAGEVGCILAWMAYIAGYSPGLPVVVVCEQLTGGISEDEFLLRLSNFGVPSWTFIAARAAECLRLYADKYHPEDLTAELAEADREHEAYRRFRTKLDLSPKTQEEEYQNASVSS